MLACLPELRCAPPTCVHVLPRRQVSLVAVMVTHAPLTEQGSLSRVEQLEFNV